MKDPEKNEPEPENAEASEDLGQDILEEIEIEDLTVDGICGVY
jgi:mycofactocin precursor